MKKFLKIVAILVAVAALLLVGATVALRVLLPPEKAKALVLKHLTEALKREVKVGEVSVGVLTGLSLSDLKISESPNFSKGTFVSSKHFSIKLALLPLLSKKIEVKQLVLDAPVINVVRYAGGQTFNFSDLIPSTATAKTAEIQDDSAFALIPNAYAAPAVTSASGSEPSFALLVSHALIQNGTVRFTDQSPAKQSVLIDALNLKVSNVSMTSPFSVQVSLNAKANNLAGQLKLAGNANLAVGSFDIKTCTLSTGEAAVNVEGKAERLKSDKPLVNLKLNVKDLKLASLKPLVSLPPTLKLDKPIQANAHLQGDAEKMDFSLQSTYGSIQLQSHGKVLAVKSPQPQIQMHAESNAFPISELLEISPKSVPADLKVAGQAAFSADVSGTQTSSQIAAKIEGKDLSVSMADKFTKPAGSPLRMSMTGEKIRDVVNLQNFGAVLGNIQLNGNGKVNLAGKTPTFQLAMKSKPFLLQELAQFVPLLGEYKPSGTAQLDVRASGTSDNPLANGTLALQNAAIQYQQSDLTQMNSNIAFTQQDVSIPKLTGKLNGADLVLKLTGRQLTTQPDVRVDGTLSELDLNKFLATPEKVSLRAERSNLLTEIVGLLRRYAPRNDGLAWAAPAPLPPMALSGTFNVGRIKHTFYDAKNMEMRWNLKDVTPDLSRVSGSADLKQGAGWLRDLEKLAELSKSAKMALLPLVTLQKLDKKGVLKSIGLPSLDDIPFTSIRGDYTFRLGMMEIKAFDVVGRDININTLGSIGLAGEQALDVRTTMRFAPGLVRGTLGQLLTDESGRAVLAFTAKGTVSNPQVKADLRDAGRKAVQQLGQELLKGLGVGSPQQPSAPAPDQATDAPAADQPAERRDPAKDLEKVFKNIFK